MDTGLLRTTSVDANYREIQVALKSIKLHSEGVYVQASTLGSLEALLEYLRSSKVKYSAINIGPINKRDIMKERVRYNL